MHNRYRGREIAARAVAPLVNYLLELGVTPASLPSMQHMLQPGLRISWHQFHSILEVAQAHLNAQELEAVGAIGLTSDTYRRRLAIARRLLTLEDAYRFLVYPHKQIDFGCIQAAVAIEPGKVWITAVLHSGYEPSETFFRIMLGAAKKLPELFGEQEAQVEGEISGRSLKYRINYVSKDSTGTRIKRYISHRIRTAYCAFNLGNAYEALVKRTFALEAALVELDQVRSELGSERAEQARRMEHVAEVIVEYDALNRVVYLSPNAEKVFGYANQLLMERPLSILRPQDRTAAEAFFSNPKQFPNGVYPMQAQHASGALLNLEVALSHFEDADRQPRWIATFRDVTSRELTSPDEVKPAVSTPPDLRLVSAASLSDVEVDQPTLLLAEDDPRTQKIGRKILERAGFRVICAEDGLAALQRLEHQRIAGLLLDVDMPEMSGLEVYEVLQQRGPGLPIVFVCGDPERVLKRYPQAVVLGKPFRADQLVAVVRKVLAA